MSTNTWNCATQRMTVSTNNWKLCSRELQCPQTPGNCATQRMTVLTNTWKQCNTDNDTENDWFHKHLETVQDREWQCPQTPEWLIPQTPGNCATQRITVSTKTWKLCDTENDSVHKHQETVQHREWQCPQTPGNCATQWMTVSTNTLKICNTDNDTVSTNT